MFDLAQNSSVYVKRQKHALDFTATVTKVDAVPTAKLVGWGVLFLKMKYPRGQRIYPLSAGLFHG
jgi:hypothetical protein